MGDWHTCGAFSFVSQCSESLLGLTSEKSWNKPGVKTGPVRA